MDNQISVNLFKQLNKENIKYAVLRNYKTLPESLGGSDIDLWVCRKDVKAFFRIIENVAKEQNAHMVSYLPDTLCPKVCYMNSECGIQIDVFCGCIPYQNTEMIQGEVIQKHIQKYKDIYVLDDQLANLVAFIKEIVNNGTSGEKYIKPLYDNADLYSLEYIQSVLTLFSAHFSEALHEAIQGKQLVHKFEKLKKLGRSSLKTNNIFLHKISKVSRFWNKPGYVISVQGTDGSGKSTIIDAITPWLEEAFHNGIIYNHLRPNVLPDMGVALGKKEALKDGEKPKVVSDPHAQKPSGFIGSIVRWGYYMMDYTFGYAKSVYPKIATKAKVFIFDRYYYDYYIDQRRSRTSLPQWVLRFGEIFVPVPDVILCLGGDPKKIYERKPETSLEEVTRQTNVMKRFCNKRKNVVWVDTTLTPEESIRLAKEAILDMLSKRFNKVTFL